MARHLGTRLQNAFAKPATAPIVPIVPPAELVADLGMGMLGVTGDVRDVNVALKL